MEFNYHNIIYILLLSSFSSPLGVFFDSIVFLIVTCRKLSPLFCNYTFVQLENFMQLLWLGVEALSFLVSTIKLVVLGHSFEDTIYQIFVT